MSEGERGFTLPGDRLAMVGASKRRRKLGEIVAERIIGEIIRRGWNEGEVLGTEADFMDMFRVSRATFREAVRQLEWHGAAGMRRGVYGGLVVKAPPRHAIVYGAKTYFGLASVDRALLDEAAAVLRAAPRLRPGQSENQAIGLFLEALDTRTITDLANERMVAGSLPKLSETIALKLVQDIEQAGAKRGANLGNEGELQRRYGVSRAVLREALRPLELHDIVRVKTGAQGGVIIRECDPTYTIELTSTYLTYSRIPLSHLWEAQSALEIAAVEKFVHRANAESLQALRKALARLENASASHYLAAAGEFHQIVADRSGNPALALFVGVALRYGLIVMPRPDENFLPELKAQHSRMVDAIAAGDRDAAMESMRAMFDHARRWIRRIERRQDQIDAEFSG